MFQILAGLCIFYLLFMMAHGSGFLGMGKDDSDSGSKRSGMMVMTDYKTGVQYLMSPLGGLTPRLNEDGKPVIKDKPNA